MNSTPAEALLRRQTFARVLKFTLRRVLAPLGVLAAFAAFPKTVLFYLICGAYDVSRNRPLTPETLRRYFLGNGVALLSPLNSLLDLLSLPYVNKGIYQLADLPPAHQDEIRRLIQAANDADLVRHLAERSKENQRTMLFFRWYGANLETSLKVPAFHQPWKYIQTIGVSVFNRRVTTSKHFGHLRASLRVLYNLNDLKDDSAYIVVGDTVSRWRENKLFIFDDTLMHLSANETDEPRYCLFVDIIRPTLLPAVMTGMVAITRYLTANIKYIYYANWKVIR